MLPLVLVEGLEVGAVLTEVFGVEEYVDVDGADGAGADEGAVGVAVAAGVGVGVEVVASAAAGRPKAKPMTTAMPKLVLLFIWLPIPFEEFVARFPATGRHPLTPGPPASN